MATIHAIHGFIGAGKTTYAKKLMETTNAVLLNHDEWMFHFYGEDSENFPYCFERITSLLTGMASKILKSGTDVIFDWGFWDKDNPDYFGRKQLIEYAKNNNADLMFYSVKCGIQEGLSRTLGRSKEEQPILITQETYFDRLKRFSRISPEEWRFVEITS